MRLHMVGQNKEGAIPFLEMIALTTASENDLSVFKNECVSYLSGKTVPGEQDLQRQFRFCLVIYGTHHAKDVQCMLHVVLQALHVGVEELAAGSHAFQRLVNIHLGELQFTANLIAYSQCEGFLSFIHLGEARQDGNLSTLFSP
ncbi:MAG: hypothetical protein ACI358_03925 [Candidatus Limimorpha sp.]